MVNCTRANPSMVYLNEVNGKIKKIMSWMVEHHLRALIIGGSQSMGEGGGEA